MYLRMFIGFLALCQAAFAGAQALPPQSMPRESSGTAQALYKGVAGNLLELAPLDEPDRLTLQRTSAVVGNPLGARSLAIAIGVATGPLMVLGLAWGLWAASNIKPATPTPEGSDRSVEVDLTEAVPSSGGAATQLALDAAVPRHAAADAIHAFKQDELLAGSASLLRLCTPADPGRLMVQVNAAVLDRAAEFMSSVAVPAAGYEFAASDGSPVCETCYGPIGMIRSEVAVP